MVPARRATWAGGKVRQPYAGVDTTPQVMDLQYNPLKVTDTKYGKQLATYLLGLLLVLYISLIDVY